MQRSRSADTRGPGERRSRADSDEAALIGRVARGDTAAFETLFRRYYPRLKRFLEQKIRRPQLVDEIFNETMLVVWRKANTFNLRSKVSTWIMGIALRRGLKAVQHRDEASASYGDEATIAAQCGPEDHVLRQEQRSRMSSALTSLSAEHRAVIELTFYEGYTYREIATIVDCPVDTVKTRMFHARRRLKQLLAQRGEEAA